ncbi:hypothetical protein [Vibrio tasmaniensis]|nr:hypothetical protein [Vibrio tasmaniensis]
MKWMKCMKCMKWIRKALGFQTHEEKRCDLKDKLKFALSQSVAR